jgi:hypothetical protein
MLIGLIREPEVTDTLDLTFRVRFLSFAFHALRRYILTFGSGAGGVVEPDLNAGSVIGLSVGQLLWGLAASDFGAYCRFVTQMPAYYATWGDIPAGWWCCCLGDGRAVDIVQKGPTRARLASLAILTGGLFRHITCTYLFAIFLSFAARRYSGLSSKP